MNAPALNPAATPATGSVGLAGTAITSGQADGPLAGFEALLSALFPQGATAGAGTGQAIGTPDTVKSSDSLGEATDDPDLDLPSIYAGTLSGDANAALLASGLAGQPLIATNTIPSQPAETGPAQGRDNGAGVSTASRLFNADLKADAQGITGTVDDPRGGPDLASNITPTAAPVRAEASPLSPGQGARPAVSPQAPVQPFPDPAAVTPAASASDTASAERLSTPAVAVATSLPPSATGLIARPEPTPAPTARAVRTERNRTASDVRSSDGAGALPVGETVTTLATTKTASDVTQAANAGPEKADAATRDADAVADAPDATLQAETRAAAQSLTPATLTAHGVRGSPETIATLAAQIIKKLEGQSTRFDLELNPAGLGKVDVRIDIGAHGRVSAAMMFDNPQAAADLRARATELQRMLEQAGFDMSGGLSFDVAGDRSQQQRQSWQDQNDNSGQAFRGQAFRAALDTAGNATDVAIQGALRLRRGINAGLDLRI